MTAWQKLGDPDRPMYRRTLDPKAMYGVKRIDVTHSDEGTLIITVETMEGTMSTMLGKDDR